MRFLFLHRLIVFVVWLGWPRHLSGVDWGDIRNAWHNSGVSTFMPGYSGCAWEYVRDWLAEVL